MSHDTWIHRVARIIVTKPLSLTSVTPNQVTTARLATGMAAAAAVGIGLPVWRDVGAAIFVLSVILDRADGDLARMTGRTSAGGHRYDLIADSLSNGMVLIGLGIGLRDGAFGLWAIAMGIVGGISVSVILHRVLALEKAAGARAGELPGLAGFDIDDLVLLIPLAIWFDWVEPLLLAVVICAPLFAVFFHWHVRYRLRPAAKAE